MGDERRISRWRLLAATVGGPLARVHRLADPAGAQRRGAGVSLEIGREQVGVSPLNAASSAGPWPPWQRSNRP